MRLNLLRPALLGSLFVCLASASSPARATAQDAGNPPADTHDDNGFDKGLLGLVGLAGLLGLRRQDRDHANRGVPRNDASRATSRV